MPDEVDPELDRRITLAAAFDVMFKVYNAAIHNGSRAARGEALAWPVLDGGDLRIDIDRGLALLRCCWRDLTDPDDRAAVHRYADALVDAQQMLDEARASKGAS